MGRSQFMKHPLLKSLLKEYVTSQSMFAKWMAL